MMLTMIRAMNSAGVDVDVGFVSGGTRSTTEVFTMDTGSSVGCGTFLNVTSHRMNAVSSSRSLVYFILFLHLYFLPSL